MWALREWKAALMLAFFVGLIMFAITKFEPQPCDLSGDAVLYGKPVSKPLCGQLYGQGPYRVR